MAKDDVLWSPPGLGAGDAVDGGGGLFAVVGLPAVGLGCLHVCGRVGWGMIMAWVGGSGRCR